MQELVLSIDYGEGFEELKYATFTKLRILNIHYGDPESFIKFLENNGENLEELEYYSCYNLVNLAISKFCLKLKFLHTDLMK